MGLKKYFKNEINKQCIFCSIPFLFLIMIFTYQIVFFNKLGHEGQCNIFFLILYTLLFSIGIILFSIYFYSYKKYKEKISSFYKDEFERINKEALTLYNMGKLLITNDVVIYFGFFKKEVIPTKIIEDVENIESTYKVEGRVSASIDYQNIILKCINNKQVVIPAPKNYNGTECKNCKRIIKYIIDNKNINKEGYIDINSLDEASVFSDYKEFRISNFMWLIIAIPYIVLCLIINGVIKNTISNGSDSVLKTFYSVGIKEFLCFIEIIIYTIIFVVINVYYRFHNKNVIKGNTAIKYFKNIVLFVLILLNLVFFTTSNYDYQKDVRSDFLSHLKSEYKTYTGEVSYYKGVNYKDVS